MMASNEGTGVANSNSDANSNGAVIKRKYADLSFKPTSVKSLTLWEKISAVFQLFKLLPILPYILLKARFGQHSKSGKPWAYYVRSRVLSFLLSRVHPRQIHMINKPTAERVEEMSKRLRVAVTTDEVGAGGKIHWWGERKGQKVLLHLHGGGYNLSLGGHHILFDHRLKAMLKKKHGMDVDVGFVEYSLTPVHRYPTQLTQSVEALRYLLDVYKYDPADIILLGDSAGGALAIGVISHILHTHPAIQPLILPESSPSLAGLIAVSPWTSFDTAIASLHEKNNKDIVFPHMVDIWARWYVDRPDEPRNPQLPPPPAEGPTYSWDEYNQPNMADASWWAGFPVKKALVLVGEEERMRDAMIEFADAFKVAAAQKGPDGNGGAEVQAVVCTGEMHTECFYDAFVPGVPPVPGVMTESLWAFCEDGFKA